jgi:hypothetical protein
MAYILKRFPRWIQVSEKLTDLLDNPQAPNIFHDETIYPRSFSKNNNSSIMDHHPKSGVSWSSPIETTIHFLDILWNIEIADYIRKIRDFAQVWNWWLPITVEQVSSVLRILNIANSTHERIHNILHNTLHLYAVMNYAKSEDTKIIPTKTLNCVKQYNTLFISIISDIFTTLQKENIYIPTWIPGFIFLEAIRQWSNHKDTSNTRLSFDTLCNYLTTDFGWLWANFDYPLLDTPLYPSNSIDISIPALPIKMDWEAITTDTLNWMSGNNTPKESI